MNPGELFQAGKLDEAIAGCNELLKKNPADIPARSLLCELLCFAGNLERADSQLETIGKQDPKAAVGVALFRQLIRAEQARQQFFHEGRMPEFMHDPTPVMKLHLQASIMVREGSLAEAAKTLADAEEQRIKPTGECNGDRFDDLRDLDDLTAPIFEVLTSNGKYYWIPIETVDSLEFEPPERPRDLLWRPTHIVVRGTEGDVYMPTLYPGSASDPDEKIRLGRVTDWRGGEESPVRGIGLRSYLVGESDQPILELKELRFDSAEGAESPEQTPSEETPTEEP
jgi:type VI secretion system protein ImpE